MTIHMFRSIHLQNGQNRIGSFCKRQAQQLTIGTFIWNRKKLLNVCETFQVQAEELTACPMTRETP